MNDNMLIDITRTLGLDSVCWPGDHELSIEPASRMADGDEVNLAKIVTTNHAGTHLDAPLHMLADGRSLDDYPIDRFRLPVEVIEVPSGKSKIDLDAIAGHSFAEGEGALFKTSNSELPRDRFCEDYVSMKKEAAEVLAAANIGLVGVDYLSVDAFGDSGFPAHRALLGAGVLILEDVDLREVAPGRYTLMCFPLKMQGANGAPCRAALEVKHQHRGERA